MQLSDIKVVQIEITNNCQAMCPGCQRNVDGITVNPTLITGAKGNMPFDIFQKALPVDLLKTLDRIEFNGNFGDAPFNPQLKEFIQYIIKNKNDNLYIEMSTNGGMHNTQWWADLAKLWMFNEECSIWFAIDGTDNETQQIYRRNVNYDKAIENARAFIDAGGNAHWQFIVFDHNEHQVKTVYELAKEYGFNEVRTNKTRTAFNVVYAIKSEKEDFVHIAKENKKYKPKVIKQTDGTDWKKGKEKVKDYIKTKHKSTDSYFDTTTISCSWRKEQKIMIEHDATVWQCCYFVGTYLYYPDGGPSNNQWDGYYVKKYPSNFNSLYKHSLEEIINDTFWKNDLQDSWNNITTSIVNPRLEMCANHCGEHLSVLNNM